MDKYSEIYPVDFHGLTKGFGTWRHYCPTNTTYREYSRKIAKKIAEHYHDNKDVIAWQIDNEFGGHCCCESGRKGFATWLKAKLSLLNNPTLVVRGTGSVKRKEIVEISTFFSGLTWVRRY